MNTSRIVSYIVLIGLLFALYMNWSWPWGVIFIIWLVPSIRFGESFLVSRISRREDPFLFWIITLLWVLLGVLMILQDATPVFVNEIYAFIWRM